MNARRQEREQEVREKTAIIGHIGAMLASKVAENEGQLEEVNDDIRAILATLRVAVKDLDFLCQIAWPD